MKYFKFKSNDVREYYRVSPDDTWEFIKPDSQHIKGWNPDSTERRWTMFYNLYSSQLEEISKEEAFLEIL